MSKRTTRSVGMPVDRGFAIEEPVDGVVLAFRSDFEVGSMLDELVRTGAQRMLQAAINGEVDEFVAHHADRRDEQGRRQAVRNGHLLSRELLTGGPARPPATPRAGQIS